MEINREKLFAEVWATPITHLCKTYGLSDQGLRKLCVKVQIPLPQRGHWAKIAAGHTVVKPALPALRPNVEERNHRSMKSISVIGSGFGSASTTSMLVDVMPPTQPPMGSLHPLLTVLFREYEQAELEARLLQTKFIWESEHPGKRYTGKAPTYGSWQRFCDTGKILRPTHKKSLLRVSLGTYWRAFQLMHELIERLQATGFEISVPKSRERLEAKRGSAVLNIKVCEKFDAGHRQEINSWSKAPRLVRTLSPTGRLTIGIEQMGLGETLISDRTKELLESQWDRVMTAVEYRHAQSLVKVAEWARSKQEYEDRERERQERLRLQEEARQAEEAEQARRHALLQEARDWHEAELLRSYLLHLENLRSAGGTPLKDYESWTSWAGNPPVKPAS